MKKNLIIGTIVLVLLATGLVAGLFLVQQQQELRKKAAPATTLSILPPTKTASVGDEVILTVQMNTATNTVTGAELHITFDSQKLTLKSFTPLTDLLPVVFASPQIDNTKGTASMTTSAQPANPPQGQGGLATLKFTAKAPGAATVSFAPETLATGIGEGTNVLASQNNAAITILAANPTPTPAQLSASPSVMPSLTPIPTTTAGLGGRTTTPTPTPTSRSSSATSSATPVVGVSMPIVASLVGGLALLVLGIVLAL